ncbi:MAG: LemA family protein [Spirochaetales bacterium]|uniref:LemA family protein n=1 Tax=Candidatus Thalassospirochaeta sargassi TaxID=3119039 RepID=A0AAJ1IHZ1_9SPIO|nr:LemA family protein [Spirochaetales bacterium]
MSIGLIIIIVAVIAIAGFFVSTYNGFIRLRNKVEEAFATMDAYLKKRWDLIPNLVETVKGYAKHEQDTLEKVIQARNLAMNSSSMSELQSNENTLAAGLKSIFALSEAYPDLKANQNFVNLQNQLQSVENDILQSRKYYNAVVKSFNTKRELFPASIIAGMMNLEKKEYFEIDDEERENVKVSF